MRAPVSQPSSRQRLLVLVAAVLVAVAMIRVALPRVNGWVGPIRVHRDALRATVASLQSVDLSQFGALREAAAREQAELATAEANLPPDHDPGGLLRSLGRYAHASGVALGVVRPVDVAAADAERLRPYGTRAYAVTVGGQWAGVHAFVRQVSTAEPFIVARVERVGRSSSTGQLTADLILTVLSRSGGPVPIAPAAGTPVASPAPTVLPVGMPGDARQ